MHPSELMVVCRYGTPEYLFELLCANPYPIVVLEEGMREALAVDNKKNVSIIMGLILYSQQLTEEYAAEEDGEEDYDAGLDYEALLDQGWR